MSIEAVATMMVVLFLLVIAGFIAHKAGIMGGEFDRRLSNLVILVTCPCLILSSTMGDTMPDRRHILPLLLIGACTYAFLITAARFIPLIMPINRADRGIYSFMLTFANVGFIGYPVVASIFGSSAVFYACILNVANTLSVFIWGVMFITGGKSSGFNLRLLFSPAMTATYISILIVVFGWRLPDTVNRAFTMLGDTTVPASLLIVGSGIAGVPTKRMLGSRGVYMMCVFRLFILPVAVFLLLVAAGVDRTIAGINMILIGMPVASFGTMFCMKYGHDETVMSQGTFISTLLAVVSIPLLTMII